MRSADHMPDRPRHPLIAAVLGALAALVVGYGISYLLCRLGLSAAQGVGESAGPGIENLKNAALNLYAVQHIRLVGAGEAVDALGNAQRMSASISLPLTIWACIPAVGLLVGGYTAAKMSIAGGRWRSLARAVFAGVLFAAAMTGLCGVVRAGIDSSVFPAVDGWSFNPPAIEFQPSVGSTALFAGLFGVVFSYLGGLMAVPREVSHGVRGRWWACGKAVVASALVIQLLIACAALWWWTARADTGDKMDEPQARIVDTIPAAAGAGYALVHGSSLVGGVEVLAPGSDEVSRPFQMNLNLYAGMETADDEDSRRSTPSAYVYILTAFSAAALLLCGVLGVRWGSADGSLPTAARITIIHSVYLYLVMKLCSVAWSSEAAVGEFSSRTAVYVAPAYSHGMLIGAAFVFLISFAGAHLADKRRFDRRL